MVVVVLVVVVWYFLLVMVVVEVLALFVVGCMENVRWRL